MPDKKPTKPRDAFRDLAEQNRHQAKVAGKSLSDRILIETEEGLEQEKSPAVQSYVRRMLQLVRDNEESASGLRKARGVIAETARLAKDEDPTLSDRDKREIELYAHSLIMFISLRTNFISRAHRALVGKASSIRENIKDNLEASESAVFRFAAKALTGRGERNTSHMEARADLYEHLAEKRERSARFRADNGRFMSASEFEPKSAEDLLYGDLYENDRSPKRAGRGYDMGGVGSAQLIAIETSQLEVLKAMYGLLRDEREDVIRRREQEERDADNVKPEREREEREPEKKPEEKSGIFDFITKGFASILSGAKNLFSGFGPILVTFGRAIASSMGIMGRAGLALAAAVATWETGKFLEQLTRDDNSWWKKGLSSLQDEAGQLFASPKDYFTKHLQGQRTDYDATRDALRDKGKQTPAQGLTDFAKSEVQSYTKQVTDMLSHLPGQTVPAPERQANTAAPQQAPVPSKSVSPIVIMPKMTPAARPDTAPERMTTLRMSDKGIQQLMQREGLPKGETETSSHKAYLDDAGVWTIGHGLTTFKGKPVTPDLVITPQEEREEFARQLRVKYEPIVRKNLKGKSVPQDVYDALVSVAYNSEAAGAKLSRRVAAGERLTKEDFLASATVHGVRHHGLENRRTAEYQQYAASFAPGMPAPLRTAEPVATLTRAQQAAASNITVVAPQTVVSGNGQQQSQSPMVIPIPMSAENPDATLRGLRSINGA